VVATRPKITFEIPSEMKTGAAQSYRSGTRIKDSILQLSSNTTVLTIVRCTVNQ
jgi:hypothetical protein